MVFAAGPRLVKTFAVSIGNEHVAGAVDETGAAVVFRGCLVNRQACCGAQVAAADFQTIKKDDAFGRIKRVVGGSEEAATKGIRTKYGRRCKQHHRLDLVGMVARRHRRHHATLRVTDEGNILNVWKLADVCQHAVQILNLIRDCHIPEFPVAFTVPVEIKNQRSHAVGLQLFGSHLQKVKLLVAVETVAENNKVALCAGLEGGLAEHRRQLALTSVK